VAAYVGVYLARLEMPWVKSLKEKRALVRPVIERVRARFPVSAARLDGLDAHGWETVGFVIISNDPKAAERVLREVAAFLAENGVYRVGEEHLEVVHWDTDEPRLLL